MFNNPFSMVVAIVLIVSVAGILRARWGLRRDRHGDYLPPVDTAETQRLRDEVKMLKDRVAVLERIATDTHDTVRIDQEIAKLRDS